MTSHPLAQQLRATFPRVDEAVSPLTAGLRTLINEAADELDRMGGILHGLENPFSLPESAQLTEDEIQELAGEIREARPMAVQIAEQRTELSTLEALAENMAVAIRDVIEGLMRAEDAGFDTADMYYALKAYRAVRPERDRGAPRP